MKSYLLHTTRVFTSFPVLLLVGLLAGLAASTNSARADLLAFYEFDNAGDPFLDSSPNATHITDTAGTDPIWGAATGFNSTGAYDFSGDRLIVPIDVNPGVMPSMTWGAWVRTDDIGTGLRKVLGHDNGAWDRTLGLDERNPNGAFRYTAFTGDNPVNASGPVEGTPAPISTTDWTFLAASHDQANLRITVYIDLDASTTEDPVLSFTEPAGFGAGWNTFAIGGIRPDNASEAWDGAIDNVFIFNEVLTPEKVTGIRNRGRREILGIPDSDPDLQLSSSNLFGDLRSLGPGEQTATLNISNIGATQDLNISGITINGTDASRYALVPPIPAVIPPLGDADLDITFAPAAGGGSFEATLEFTTDDLDSQMVTVLLDARVASDPKIELDPAAGTLFGVVTDPLPATRAVLIRNRGVLNTLNLSDVRITGADAARFRLVTAPASLAPGEEATVMISFDDGGVVGSYAATLEVDSDDGDTPTVSLPLDARSLTPTPAGDLIAFYPFDDPGNPLLDNSGVTGDATVGGGAPIFDETGGFEGGCYQFNGTDWLVSPLDINPAGMPHMTMGAWVRTDSTADGLRKVMGHDDGAWDRVIGLDTRTTASGGPQPQPNLRYTAFTGTSNNGPVQFTPAPVSTEDYTFLAVTYDETNALVSLYVDLDASTTTDPLDKTTEATLMGPGQSTLAIGAIRPDNGSEGWTGRIDNAFVFDGVLNDSEITNLRNGGKEAFLGRDNFRITEIICNADNTVTLTWNSDPTPGTTYRVLFNPDFELPLLSWPDDEDGVPTGGETTTHTTVNAFPQARMFFVVVEN